MRGHVIRPVQAPEIDHAALNKVLDRAFREEDLNTRTDPSRGGGQDGWCRQPRHSGTALDRQSVSKSIARLIGRAMGGLLDPAATGARMERQDRDDITLDQLLVNSGRPLRKNRRSRSDLCAC